MPRNTSSYFAAGWGEAAGQPAIREETEIQVSTHQHLVLAASEDTINFRCRPHISIAECRRVSGIASRM